MDTKRIKQYAEKVRQDSLGLNRRVVARVVGVTFEGRQEVLAEMDSKTPVRLERDRRNKYDFHAVKVMACLNGKWVQAGFIPRRMSSLISRSLDNGVALSAKVHRLTGGFYCEVKEEMANHGLEIAVVPER
jgi:hypothetical protein